MGGGGKRAKLVLFVGSWILDANSKRPLKIGARPSGSDIMGLEISSGKEAARGEAGNQGGAGGASEGGWGGE